MKYILASASPRRVELLSQAGFTFDVLPAGIDEHTDAVTPWDAVTDLALQKALAVSETLPPEGEYLIIGADTVVSYRGEVLGKPENEAEAMDMLCLLSDRTHQVYTGVALVHIKDGAREVHTFHECTDVTFYPIDRADLAAYISTGDCMDKAGSYGIQGAFAVHVRKISGDYNNVVGLPIARLYQELKHLR